MFIPIPARRAHPPPQRATIIGGTSDANTEIKSGKLLLITIKLE